MALKSLLALCAAALAAPAGAPGPQAVDPAAEGGLRVWRFEGTDLGSFRVLALVGVGSRDEPEDQTGISHFLEHCLFNGTDLRTGAELTEGLRDRGGDYNGVTTQEYTAYWVQVPVTEWRFAVEWLAEILTRPALDADEVDDERRIVYEEIDTRHPHVRSLTFESLIFGRHPLGRTIGGDAERFDEIRVEDLKRWYGRYYHAENLVVAWSGLAPEEACSQLIRAGFAGLPASGERPERASPRPITGAEYVARGDDDDGFLLAGYSVPPGGAGELASMLVLEQVLREAVHHEVREERHLAYAPDVELVAFSDVWQMRTNVEVSDVGNLVSAWEGVQEVFGGLAQIEQNRFERARQDASNRLLAGGPDALRRVTALSWLLVLGGDESPDLPGAVRAVDREDALAWAASSFTAERRFLLSDGAELVGFPLLALVLLLVLAGAAGVFGLRRRLPRIRWRRARRRRPPRGRLIQGNFAAEAEAAERELQEYFRQQDHGQESGDEPTSGV